MSRDERGSVSVLIIAVLVLGLALAAGAARMGSALIARSRAETAADAAALAAADSLALWRGEGAARGAAAGAAADNGARVVACEFSGNAVTVTVEFAVPLLRRVARATARAEVGPG